MEPGWLSYQKLIDQIEQSVSCLTNDGFIQEFLLLLGWATWTDVDFELLRILRSDVHTGTMQPVGADIATDVESKRGQRSEDERHEKGKLLLGIIVGRLTNAIESFFRSLC